MARAPAASTPDGIAKRLKRAEAPTGWQKRLDKALLDVDISMEQRVRLLQKVAKDGKKVSSDVRVAVEEIREKGMGKGHPLVLDLLFPTGTTVRSDLEGLFALRKQVPEVLSSLEPPTLDAVQSATPPPDPFTVASQLASLATDEKKQKEVLYRRLQINRGKCLTAMAVRRPMALVMRRNPSLRLSNQGDCGLR